MPRWPTVHAGGLANDLDQHSVAGGGVEGVARGNEELRPDEAIDDGRADEAVAALGPAKRARGGAVWRRQLDQVVLAQLDHALLEQGAQHVAELGVAARGQVELAGQRFGFEGLVGLLVEQTQDGVFEVGHEGETTCGGCHWRLVRQWLLAWMGRHWQLAASGTLAVGA